MGTSNHFKSEIYYNSREQPVSLPADDGTFRKIYWMWWTLLHYMLNARSSVVLFSYIRHVRLATSATLLLLLLFSTLFLYFLIFFIEATNLIWFSWTAQDQPPSPFLRTVMASPEAHAKLRKGPPLRSSSGSIKCCEIFTDRWGQPPSLTVARFGPSNYSVAWHAIPVCHLYPQQACPEVPFHPSIISSDLFPLFCVVFAWLLYAEGEYLSLTWFGPFGLLVPCREMGWLPQSWRWVSVITGFSSCRWQWVGREGLTGGSWCIHMRFAPSS